MRWQKPKGLYVLRESQKTKRTADSQTNDRNRNEAHIDCLPHYAPLFRDINTNASTGSNHFASGLQHSLKI